MSSEPYTPEETILRDICVTSMRMDGIEFDRFIAKVKADALREAGAAVMGERLETETEAGNWLDERARETEAEA